MPLLDTIIVVVIVLFLIFLVWSRVMGQTMLETFREVIGIFQEVGDG